MRFRLKLNAKSLTLSTFALLSLATCYLVLTTARSASTVHAQDLGSEDIKCIADNTAKYMNAVIAGAGDLSKIKLLSPAFNMTSRYFGPIVTEMKKNDGGEDVSANFSGVAGIAGNAYNFAGKKVTEHVESAYSLAEGAFIGKPALVAETGKIDFGLPELRTELGYIQSGSHNNIDYIGATLFNAFNTNPTWNSFKLSDPEIGNACSGKCGNIGVNSATFFSQNEEFYSRAKDNNGMGFTLEIASNNVGSAIDGIKKAQAKGLVPVIRIGVGNDSGGFGNNPQTYVEFLKQINSNPDVTGPIYAIAGPNEPESEPWFLPDDAKCKTLESPLLNAKCNEVTFPEFHTLRPYPANPCNLAVNETTYMCSNQFVTKETFKVRPSQGSCEGQSDGSRICTYNMASSIQTSVNLDKAFLPILGNTELVPNSQKNEDQLTPAQRVNDYVSWYLNGAYSEAEEEKRKSFNDLPADMVDKLVNFSGPLKKLLPWETQADNKLEEVEEARKSRYENAGLRHDQIVGCTSKTVGEAPENCYFDAGGRGLLDLLATLQIRLTDWINHYPPFSKDFDELKEYLKSYKLWRGSLFCYDLPFGFWGCTNLRVANFWSELFQYIPQSSTEDRIGTEETRQPPTSKTTGTGIDEVRVTDISYQPTGATDLMYFAHMEEVAELSATLQKTFTPRGVSGDTNSKLQSESPTIGPGCTVIETRTNPGDKLYADKSPETISGTLTYNTQFQCQFSPPDQNCIVSCVEDGGTIDNCTDQCTQSTCTKDVFVGIPMGGQTPKVEEIWNRLVEGDFSVFKRIFPKIGEDTPFGKLKDIPGVTTGEYIATGGSGSSTVSAIAGDESAQRPGSSAEIYFPHVGSLHEYFLRGIQTALRPKGFSDLSLSGIVPPSDTETLVGGTGSCSVDFLKPIWGSETTSASCVCEQESSGKPNAFNDSCLRVGGTLDYSVGLFQINMLAHCPGAFKSIGSTDANGRIVVPCEIGNDPVLKACVEKYKDGANNATYAKQLKDDRGAWGDWVNAATKCGLPI